MMNYVNYDFGGMHLFWWVLWGFMLVWIFATPYNIPGQRRTIDSPFDVLKKRFAKGEISKEEYEEMREILSN